MFINALHSEWVKARSIKSTWIIALLSFIFCFGTSLAFIANRAGVIDAESKEPVGSDFFGSNIYIGITMGLIFSIIPLVVFSVITITSEHNFNTINTSLIATPKRLVFFSSKLLFAIIFIMVNLVITMFVSFSLCFLVIQNRTDVDFISMFNSHFINQFLFAILGIVSLCLISLFIGFISRNSAAAITTSIVLVLSLISGIIELINMIIKSDIVTYIVMIFPDKLYTALTREDNVGAASIDSGSGATAVSSVEPFTNLQAGIGLINWVVILGIIAFVLFQKRDV